MLPGMGGFEVVVIAILALVVVGPKDLPMLMRKVGRAMGRVRAMADEFRASFDELARQSELDELRKEVEALRRGQNADTFDADVRSTFDDINAGLGPDTATPPSVPTAYTTEPPPEVAPKAAPEPASEPAAAARERDPVSETKA